MENFHCRPLILLLEGLPIWPYTSSIVIKKYKHGCGGVLQGYYHYSVYCRHTIYKLYISAAINVELLTDMKIAINDISKV